MLKSYIIIALRHCWKHKVFSFINIAGLALSMAVCLLLIMLIKDANSYDRFHANSNRIYRINTEALRKDGGREEYASSPYTAGAALVAEFPGIEAATFLNSQLHTDIIAGNRKVNFHVQFTNVSFFDLFGFTLKEGNPATVLNSPFTIVLTGKLAEKLFPGANAVGQTVEIGEQGFFRVSGVLNEFPGKTHLEFDALASLSTISSLEKMNSVSPTLTNWRNYYTNYSYIRLKPGVTIAKTETALAGIVSANYKNLAPESRDAGYRFKLQALNDITPGPLLSNNMGKGMPVTILWFLSVLALVIILSAAFNYTNLTIAKAMSRMKEIALRKVVGSSRIHIFLQVVVESVVTALLALVFATVLLQFIIPRFSGFSFIRMADISFHMDAKIMLLFIGFTIVVGTVAGLIPASVLSGFKPLMLMQRLQNVKLFRRLGIRKALLVIQFMISLVFIIMVTITYRQMQHAVNINFGSRQTHIFNIPLQGMAYEKAVQEFSKMPGVEKISAISNLMGNYSDGREDVRISLDKDPINVPEYYTDENYIDNMKLKLLAGDNFPPNPVQKNEQFAIVNEKFVETFQLHTAAEAVGKTIIVGDSTMLTIKGVLKDFLFKPAEYELLPMMMRYNPGHWSILNLRVASGNAMQITTQLENTWKKLNPSIPFTGRFYEEEIQSVFADMRDVIRMVAFIALIGIAIACLGLLGITIFMVQSRSKEISIRKVIGANPISIIRLLTRVYVQVIVMGVVLALPVAWFLGNKFLESMSQRISLNPGLFIPGILFIVLLSLLTIGSQTIRAVFLNPVKGLRTE